MDDPPLREIGRILLVVGLTLAGVGLLLILGRRIPGLGRLPGDILVRRGSWTFYAPIVTCLVVSVLLTLLWRLFQRR
ncbi:MAG TPA: DUF2905 domain-containing protein [Candidatus Polarisedimenticolaceae bacterium]|nr:DUF2905 domain-containing protein [Candidatus Polarisedimenticolaceae bacterium]